MKNINIKDNGLEKEIDGVEPNILMLMADKSQKSIDKGGVKLSVVMAKIGSSLIKRQYKSSEKCEN